MLRKSASLEKPKASELLADLVVSEEWGKLLSISRETVRQQKVSLIMSATLSTELRAMYVGQLAGLYAFIKEVYRQANVPMPGNLTEYFTGVPDAG